MIFSLSSMSPIRPSRRSAACTPGTSPERSTLVDYGFRLPSAKDNRPLNFEEFESKIDQMLFVSATPGDV